MSRDSDEWIVHLILILFGLWLLVSIAMFAAFWAILVFIVKQLTGTATASSKGPAVSMYGAPASGWWVERYERWLWRLEDLTGANFTRSPERLFFGSMLLAGCVGLPLALSAGWATSWLFGSQGFWFVFSVVLVGATTINGLSAWGQCLPGRGWWSPLQSGGSGLDDHQRDGGFLLGRMIDEE